MKIDQAVLYELQHVMTTDNEARITDPLPRPLYLQVNKVLEAAGGKWNRKAKAHLFDGDAGAALEQVLLTGEVINKKQELGFFETPEVVVDTLIALSGIMPGMDLLEPEAGRGAIALKLLARKPKHLVCFEIDEANKRYLGEAMAARAMVLNPHGAMVEIYGTDFLTVKPEPKYDRVVMNPPFAKRADVAHITHAHKFLKPGGKLVSVASSSVMWREDKIGGRFRELVDMNGGKMTALPSGSFKESGTMVNTCIVEIGA